MGIVDYNVGKGAHVVDHAFENTVEIRGVAAVGRTYLQLAVHLALVPAKLVWDGNMVQRRLHETGAAARGAVRRHARRRRRCGVGFEGHVCKVSEVRKLSKAIGAPFGRGQNRWSCHLHAPVARELTLQLHGVLQELRSPKRVVLRVHHSWHRHALVLVTASPMLGVAPFRRVGRRVRLAVALWPRRLALSSAVLQQVLGFRAPVRPLSNQADPQAAHEREPDAKEDRELEPRARWALLTRLLALVHSC
mmetsp:Transcript_88037/g.247452  ORF Transcript_88037/g.247452 Transcript_88037/m.247452 type:complete len:249 (-) Transcript_88037:1185-1931(-)